MGVQNLQSFVESGSLEGVAEPVELLHIARNLQGRSKPIKGKPAPKGLCLVLDAECCLDRLYGGYFSDWTCGGQWNRMMQFLNQLLLACQKGNIELTMAFNGALEQQRLAEWIQLQHKNRQKVQMVLRHIHNKGTPPPKVWWIPPPCLTTALRLALRYLNVPMICSMDDHHQEVLAYCRENNLQGIVGDDAEYLVFDPPRHFSASSLKLTFKGFIETKEYLVGKLREGLGLDTQGLCILTSLLGNYLLPETQLASVYSKLKVNSSKEPTETIKTLAEFVKNLENTESLDAVAVEILGNDKTDKAVKKRLAFVESVQYYLNGTKDGFLKYKPRKAAQKKPVADVIAGQVSGEIQDIDSSKFASETLENEEESLEAYAQLAEAPRTTSQFLLGEDEGAAAIPPSHVRHAEMNGIHLPVNGTSGPDSPPSTSKEVPTERERDNRKNKWWRLPPEVVRTAGERHQKGVMSPFIYQIITQGEVKLPVILEDEHQREMPNVHMMYQPVRQSIYAILFNVHHHMYLASKDQVEERVVPELPTVKEWHFPYHESVVVKAEPISWPVPTVQRLWFGTNIEDMRRRLRAFLTCMKSDTPLMVSAAYVPQHLLVMASVLRYLMQAKIPVLRQLELDAFIATAFCPDLMDSDYSQGLQLQMVTPRGVDLATLFMQGVETAILANEACGAPIPYLMCSPWLYFDGKLFHYILAKTEFVKSLQELCNHRMDILVKVERMRHAILENLPVQYARRSIASLSSTVLPYAPAGMVPAGYNPQMDGRRPGPIRGGQRRTVSARGGQLEVAGVVVCSWGPNYSLARDRNQPQQGGMSGGRGYPRTFFDRPTYQGQSQNQGRGFPARRRPGGPRRPKGRKQPEKKSIGRGITDANSHGGLPRNRSGSSTSVSSSESSPDRFDDVVPDTESATPRRDDSTI